MPLYYCITQLSSEKFLFAVGSDWCRDPQPVRVQRLRDCKLISPNWTSASQPLLPNLIKLLRKREWKDCNGLRWYMTTRKQHLPDIPSGCTYELIVAVKSCRTSMQASTKQNFSIEREDGNKVYQLAKEILSIYSCWERESQLFLRVRPLVGLWSSIGRSHISEYGATKIVLDVSFSFFAK